MKNHFDELTGPRNIDVYRSAPSKPKEPTRPHRSFYVPSARELAEQSKGVAAQPSSALRQRLKDLPDVPHAALASVPPKADQTLLAAEAPAAVDYAVAEAVAWSLAASTSERLDDDTNEERRNHKLR